MDFNIVTFHRSQNYGAVLQTYALQEFLNEIGYEAGIFDYNRPKVVAANPTFRARVSKLIGHFSKDENAINERNVAFAEFRRRFLNLNMWTDSKVFLSGSDQIWNLNRKIDSMFYLQFIDDKVYRASYAASMGTAKVPADKESTFSEYIRSYDAISVREEDVKECISKYYPGDISVNVDPTLLHNHSFYENIMSSVDGVPEKYILAYVLHIPQNGNALIKWLREETGSKVVLLDSTGKVGIIIKNDLIIESAGPCEFLWLFKNAECIVTTSFHGTCFSLIFEKEFYSIVNPDSPGRITNLLSKCGLTPVNETDRVFKRNNNIDWEKVRSAIREEQLKSISYFKKVYNAALTKKKSRFVGTVSKMLDACTGCAACEASCPVNAIKMVLNAKGFYEPCVNEELCIGCSKCMNQCPLNKKEVIVPESAYYGWHNDEKVLFNSSSGGAFHALAESILNADGVVYGAAYSEDWKDVVFKSTESVPLEKLQKSKYTVSNPSGVYKDIEEYLKKGKGVLFCGTPCQCAGIKSVFGLKYDNLITCDFVCGGMASLLFYREHVELLEKRFRANIVSIDFRPKDWGWGRHHLLVKFANGKKYAKRDFADSYFKCFISKAAVRKTCESCPYYHYHRSDLTIADFWGYKAVGIEKRKTGISMIVCNTKKGMDLFESVRNFNKKQMSVEYTAYTIHDKSPEYKRLQEKERFFALAEEKGFEEAANQLYDTNELHYYFKRVKKMLHLK